MYGEDNTNIGIEIKKREIFFLNNDLECTCKMGWVTCNNCFSYYSDPEWRKKMENK